MMCRVGSVVAPFCVYLADVWVYLPQVHLASFGWFCQRSHTCHTLPPPATFLGLSIKAPWEQNKSSINTFSPLIVSICVQLIVGILAFIVGVLTLLLPETLGRPLTSTLEEAEALGREPSKKRSVLGSEDAEEGLEMKSHEA